MASTPPKYPPIVRKLLRQPTVDLADACTLLGLDERSELGYRMAARYRQRTVKLLDTGRLLDVDSVRPRRNRAGEWAEIPNTKVGGKIRVRSDLLLEMVYPEGIDEALRRKGAA